VILVVLGAIAGYLLSRRLVAPIRVASLAAQRMAQGDLTIRLQAGNDEFGVLAASFNRMAENLQTKMADLEAGQARERRFVADVTHELRTPVSALVGEASLMNRLLKKAVSPREPGGYAQEKDPMSANGSAPREIGDEISRRPVGSGGQDVELQQPSEPTLESHPGACPPEVVRLAELVSTDTARLRQLVDDLLEISRLDAQAAETVMESVDLADFARRLLIAHGWADSVQVLEKGPPEPFVLRTDKRRAERILVNLVENAFHHGRAPVWIELRHAGEVIDVTVADSGPGIPPEHLAHIFDRFYKADPSRSTSRGSGLGLAIARENARLLGGDIKAENAPGGGARFVLTLPAS
jgi:two-component system sensor histidine kinase MtrB